MTRAATDPNGRLLAPFLFLAGLAPAWGQDLTLSLPIDCILGQTCYIQQYVDRDDGPDRRDFGCGRLANDAHKGTDFALPSVSAMAAGVDVLASAAGTVRGVRDGMPDISADDPNAPDLSGRECGNGVVLTHPGGWETQYCHLRQGTVRVSSGDTVAEGEPLGLVGMSGQATFPHVHLSVRRNGAVVDPFQPDASATCGPVSDATLWRSAPIYRPGGLISSGLLDRVPSFDEVRNGLPEDGLPDRAGAVVLWTYVFAGRSGDVIGFRIDGPADLLGTQKVVLDRDQPALFRAWGRRAPPGGWPQGSYSGTITLKRNGIVLETVRVAASIR